METTTIPAAQLPQLDDQFWNKIHASLLPGILHPEPDQATVIAFKGNLEEESMRESLRWMGKLNEEAFNRTKKELFSLGHLHFIEPTRFALMYIDAVTKHSNAIKREWMGPNATNPQSCTIPRIDFKGYDVEGDIAQTAELLKHKRREMFAAELDFLNAFNSAQMAEAEIFLRAVQIKRRGASSALRGEANNWHHMLALKKLDLAMFVDAWNGRVLEGAIIETRLYGALEKILYACVISTFALIPSREGELKKQRQGEAEFVQEHLGMYLREAIPLVGKKLLSAPALTETSFKELVNNAFEERTRSFVAMNPLIQAVRIIWR